jgi:hypothetical protein
MIALALSSVALAAAPAAASETITVTGQYGVGVVFNNTNVKGMQPLPGGASDFNYAGNPDFFDGKLACAIGRNSNYAIENATARLVNDPKQPARRPVCTEIIDGSFTLNQPYGRNVDLVLADDQGNVLGWIADDTVTNYHN